MGNIEKCINFMYVVFTVFKNLKVHAGIKTHWLALLDTACFGKIFKFMVLRLLENAFVIQNIESIHSYSCPKAILSPGSYHHLPGR